MAYSNCLLNSPMVQHLTVHQIVMNNNMITECNKDLSSISRIHYNLISGPSNVFWRIDAECTIIVRDVLRISHFTNLKIWFWKLKKENSAVRNYNYQPFHNCLLKK